MRTLTALLRKLETSKASVAAQERTNAGRRWARREITGVAGEAG